MTNVEPNYGVEFMRGFMVGGLACTAFWGATGALVVSILIH